MKNHTNAISQGEAKPTWPRRIYEVLTEFEVRHVAYLPDAGRSREYGARYAQYKRLYDALYPIYHHTRDEARP